MYDPTVGRFLTEDPIGFAGGTTNLQEYVGNSPTNFTDPTGLAGEPVGHHYLPFKVNGGYGTGGLLTPRAYNLANGATTGPTSPSHNNSTYKGISHDEYSRQVASKMKDYIEAKKISPKNPITESQMREIIDNLEAGRDPCGKADDVIARYNSGAKDAAKKFAGGRVTPLKPPTNEELIERGIKYRRSGGWLGARMLGMFALVGGAALSDIQEALAEAPNNPNFKLGIKALQEGDIDKATRHMLGTKRGDGFTDDLNVKGLNKAAAAFERAWLNALERAKSEQQTEEGECANAPKPAGRRWWQLW